MALFWSHLTPCVYLPTPSHTVFSVMQTSVWKFHCVFINPFHARIKFLGTLEKMKIQMAILTLHVLGDVFGRLQHFSYTACCLWLTFCMKELTIYTTYLKFGHLFKSIVCTATLYDNRNLHVVLAVVYIWGMGKKTDCSFPTLQVYHIY